MLWCLNESALEGFFVRRSSWVFRRRGVLMEKARPLAATQRIGIESLNILSFLTISPCSKPLQALTKPPPLALDDMAKYKQRRPQIRAQAHPLLFTLMTLTAAAELGLTAFLISAGNEMWTNSAYRSLYVRVPRKCQKFIHALDYQVNSAVL